MTEQPAKPSATARAPRARRRLHLRGILRVLAYCFVVSSVLAVLALRSALGDMKESALVIGRQLSGFEDLLGTPHRLMLNGEPVNVASAMTDQSVHAVLDRFDAVCRKSGNGLAQEFERLPDTLRADAAKQLGTSDGSRLGIVRKESEGEGMVACLAASPALSKLSLKERLANFEQDGDLADVGMLRYVYAKQTPAGRTHVVSAWTDGSFHIFRLAPIDGSEPPGTDLPDVGRPADSKRLLSAEIEGAPHSVHIYDAPGQAADVLKKFDDRLSAQGWKAIPFVAEETPRGRAYSKKGVDMLVFAHPDGDHALVSMVETRSE